MVQPHVNNFSEKLISQQESQGNEQSDIDLNEVVQIICNGHISDGKSFILRSEQLPHITDSKELYLHLFGELISMIINHPPENSKLFLYITCKEQAADTEIIDLRLSGDIKMFQIDFHTNITSDEQWMSLYKNRLAECSVLAQQNGGSFSFFPICNTGCLFSISHPGKIK